MIDVSNKPINLRHLNSFGYSKTTAKPGMLVCYKEIFKDIHGMPDESYLYRLGRILGTCNDGQVIAVMTLSLNGTSCYERFIEPSEIIEVYTVPYHFLHKFFGKEWNVEEIRKAAKSGDFSGLHMDFTS